MERKQKAVGDSKWEKLSGTREQLQISAFLQDEPR